MISPLVRGLIAVADAGVKRAWLRDDLWCRAVDEVCYGFVDGRVVDKYALIRPLQGEVLKIRGLRVLPRMIRAREGQA